MTIPSSTEEMLAGIPKAEPDRLGIIPISAVIMPYFLHLDTYQVDHGHVIFDVSFEEIHEKLQLPPEYTIAGIFFDAERAMWNIMVRSEFLPVTPEGHLLPKVILSYSKNMETGMVAFTGLEIQQAP